MVSGVVEALPSGFERYAVAPGTVGVIGELTDFYGGTTIYGLTQYEVAVGIRHRQDDQINVTFQAQGQDAVSSSASLSHVSTYANAHLAGEKPQPTADDDSTAFEAAGLVWTMVHRQVLSRDTMGMDIHIVTDIPNPILGTIESTYAALALALAGNTEDINEAPMRAKLADLCTQSAHMFSLYPARTARFAAALRGTAQRGTEPQLCTIDFADESVAPTNHIDAPAWIAISDKSSATSKSTANDGEELRRRELLEQACHAFGVSSLRALPDADTRVVDWLRAVNRIHPEKATPSIEEVSAWIEYYEEESARARAARRVLASRRTDAFLEIIRNSHLANCRFLNVEPPAQSPELGTIRILAPGIVLVFGTTAPDTKAAINLEYGLPARLV